MGTRKLPKEEVDKFIDNFMDDLSQSFAKNYADFQVDTQEDIAEISCCLREILEKFPLVKSQSKAEILKCEELVIALNTIAIKNKLQLFIMADTMENCIDVTLKGEYIYIQDESLPLLT